MALEWYVDLAAPRARHSGRYAAGAWGAVPPPPIVIPFSWAAPLDAPPRRRTAAMLPLHHYGAGIVLAALPTAALDPAHPPLAFLPALATVPPLLFNWAAGVTLTINGILSGRQNTTGTVTLRPGADSTVIIDARLSAGSMLAFMPRTAAAAAELASGAMYISDQADGSATISHTNSAAADRLFRYSLIA